MITARQGLIHDEMVRPGTCSAGTLRVHFKSAGPAGASWYCDPSGPDRLAAFQVHPPQWWTILSEIEAEEDARLAKVLVICKGCFDPIGDDLPDQSTR